MRAGGRRPGAHARIGAGLLEVDRRPAAFFLEAGVRRRPFLVRAPAQLRWLHALRQEPIDRPGEDEYVARLRALGALGVALGDMHAFDAEALREARPFVFCLRLRRLAAEIVSEIDQRLLEEPGHHAGIGAAAGDGGRAARILAPLGQHRFAQGVIGARLVAHRLVVIEARPGLDDRVDIERADLAAMTHEVERRRVDRQVDAEPLAGARGQIFGQDVAVIVARDRELDEADAAIIEDLSIRIVGVDDDEAALVEFEMTLDQRQRAFADRSEADHHDRASDAPVPRPFRHGVKSPSTSRTSDAKRLRGA